MNTLAGILCVRNGDLLDYCWREAGASLLGVCDELVLCDCDSDDGTRQAMDEWASKDSRITLCNFPWTNPVATDQWYPEWINYTRQHAKSDHVLHLDADEILHEGDYEMARMFADKGATVFLNRLNFWRDAQSLIPEGHCCGTMVLRMAPKNMPLPSDYPYGPAEETMKAATASSIRVYHYGFLRKREAWFKCARVKQKIWADNYDPRLEAAEKFEGVWSTMPGITGWEGNLVPFSGTHPQAAHAWLTDRGYTA